MVDVLMRAIKDVFDKKIFFTSLIPIVIAALFWGVVFFVFHTQINSFFVYLVSHVPFFGDATWLKDIVEAVGGIFVYYQLLILTSVLIVGLIADKIVDNINDKYYHLKKNGFGSVLGSIGISLKQNAIFIVLFLILLPTMFVPLLNIFVNLILWMILIKKPMFYDSVSMYASIDEYAMLQKNEKMSTTMISLLSASLFLVPILGVFVYILQLLIFTHFNLKRLERLR
jgi:uncharacterized protein involved in cysteine biosynthesis